MLTGVTDLSIYLAAAGPGANKHADIATALQPANIAATDDDFVGDGSAGAASPALGHFLFDDD
jgi:hypothetical protein